MNARWTIDLYPAAWQRQYGNQFRNVLDRSDAGIGDTLDLLFGAARAHLQPDPAWGNASVPATTARPSASGTHPGMLRSIVLWAHVSLYIIVNIVLVGINFLVTPDHLWFGWPFWGWGIAIAAHVGVTYGSPPWLLPHALVSLWVQTGLVVINATQGGPPWAVWPVWAMSNLLVVHALRVGKRIGDFGAHLVLAGLVSLELLAVALFTPASFAEMLLVIGYVAATVAIHALYQFRSPTLLQAHALAFAVIAPLLVLDSRHEGSNWFLFPVLAWAAVLTAHAAVARMPRPETGAWEREMLTALRDDVEVASPRSSARRRIRLAGLKAHLAVAGAILGILTVINLATLENGWWVVWPLSIWLVIFAGHVGMTLFANHPALGLHLLGGGGLIAWLVALDMRTGPPTWWFWPAIVWVILGIVVVSLTVDLLRGFGDDHAPDPGR